MPSFNADDDFPGSTGRQSGEKVYQMLWDCRFCGTQKLLGVDHRHCPNCGAAQDPAWRYFPSDEDKQTISDPKYRYTGVDKLCPYCNQPNSAAANFCQQCGGDLSGAQRAAVRGPVEKGSADDIRQAEDVVLKKFQEEQARIKAQGQPSRRRTPFILLGLVAVIVVAIVGFIALSRSTYDGSMEVTSLRWERVISVERLEAVRGDDWRDSVPGDAYNLSCRTEQRAYTESETYECGTIREDRGDGSFVERPKMCTRSVTRHRPDQRCSYTVNRWRSIGDLRASGGPDDPLRWPNFTPRGGVSVGAERERSRSEALLVDFKGLGDLQGRDFRYQAPDEPAWRSFAAGQLYTVKINRLEQVQWDTLQRIGPG